MENRLAFETIKKDILDFIKDNKLIHFNNIEIIKKKDNFHDYYVISLSIHTTRTPRVLDFSNKIKVKYSDNLLQIESKLNMEYINQLKVALLIY